MQPSTEPEKSGRIINAIGMYRQQTTGNRAPITNESLHTCLKQYLSIQDWVLWQRVRTDQQPALDLNAMVCAQRYPYKH